MLQTRNDKKTVSYGRTELSATRKNKTLKNLKPNINLVELFYICYNKREKMIRKFLTIILTLNTAGSQFLFSQNAEKQTCAVLNVEATASIRSKISYLDNVSAGTAVRRELEKLGVYQVAFRQDMEQVISSDALNRCFDLTCMTETGKKLKVDKVISGAIEYVEGSIIIALREIDIRTEKVSNSKTKEFRLLPEQLKYMVQITLQEMYGLPIDNQIATALENQFGRDEYINNPGTDRLNLTGFRVGAVGIFGDNAEVLRGPRNQGGFEVRPYLFQFGYQLETQYLNQGRLQALFELIPMISGIEQGLFIPSISVLHGLRDNKTGLEFAFGATIGVSQMSKGFFDDNGIWKLENQWDYGTIENPNPLAAPSMFYRLDSRGNYRGSVGFIAAAGFSLKSGTLNIPMNVFIVSQKNSQRIGISVGINGKGRRTN
jgi:hypothetical protein